MKKPHFIFEPGSWLGEGKITFTASNEFVKFYTKWEITQESPQVFKATQLIQMQGIDEETTNSYTFRDITHHAFRVDLENEILGLIHGKGLYDERVIAWEFSNLDMLGGFENYELQENGDYFQHAEFGANDQFRTMIEGLIWRKTP